MKQLLFIIALVIPEIITSAQNLRGSYQPKADGLVKKQQVELSNAKTTGQGIVWDFRKMELPDESYTVKYALAEHDSQDSLIAGTEQRTRYYYRSTADSIMLCGYENNLTKVEYDRPELLRRHAATCQQGAYPQTDGSTALSACYDGKRTEIIHRQHCTIYL